MVTYEELRDLKEKIEQKHATSEHAREADVLILTSNGEGYYKRVHDALEETLKRWKPDVTFHHAKNACDAFLTRKGVSIFITDYFVVPDFSIRGPEPIGALVAKLYKESENPIIGIASPFFNQSPTALEEAYIRYCTRELGSPASISSKVKNDFGFLSYGEDERGIRALKEYIQIELVKRQ